MSGVDGQIGWKTETTWGTAVTVDKFSPLTSENIKNDGGKPVVSRGVKGGRRFQFVHRRGVPLIGGPVSLELGNKDVATILKHTFGAVSTTGAGPYTHTFTPGTLDDKSLTVQVGRPDSGGTVRARTFAGCKIPEATFAADIDGAVMFTPVITAKTEAGGTALATASYTSGWQPFIYSDGAITLGGSAKVVDRFALTLKNGLRADRKGIGSASITKQLGNGTRDVAIQLAMDFEDLTEYNHFLDNDALTLVIALTNGTDSFTVTAKGYLDADGTPNLTGPELLKQPLNFVVESATSDADAFTAVLVNAESTAA